MSSRRTLLTSKRKLYMKIRLLHICTVVLCLAVSACSAGSDTLVNTVNTASNTGMTVLAGAWNKSSVFRSTDSGQTWVESVLNNAQWAVNDFSSNSNDLYCASDGSGVYRSSNNGVTWQQTSEVLRSARDVLVTPAGLFACTDTSIHWSTNNGDTWNRSTLRATYLSYLASKGQMLYCCSSDFIHASSDNGKSWHVISYKVTPAVFRSLAADDSFVYADPEFGLVRSSDDGLSWQYISNPSMGFNMLTISNGSLYAVGDAGISQSTDRGMSWQQLPSDFLSSTNGVAVRGKIVFASGIGGISKSTDGGKTWKRVLTTDCLPILIK